MTERLVAARKPGRARIWVAVYLAACGLYAASLLHLDPRWDWTIADWLVDYRSGFVRRGLGGTLFEAVWVAFDVAPWTAVAFVQGAAYFTFLLLLWRLLRGRALRGWYVLLLLSPLSVGYLLRDPLVVGRKEGLFYLLLAAFTLSLGRETPSRRVDVAFGLAALGATLLHELLFFYLPWFVVAALLAGRPVRRAVPIAIGSGVAFAAIFLLGRPLDGPGTCARLLAFGADARICDGILAWPIRSIGQEVAENLAVARRDGYLRVYGLTLGFSLFPLAWAMLARPRPQASSPVSLRRGTILVSGAFLWSLPLFLASQDWGRWISIHVVAMTVVGTLILPPEAAVLTMAPAPARWPARVGRTLLVLVAIAFVGAWNPPHHGGKHLDVGVTTAVVVLWERAASWWHAR